MIIELKEDALTLHSDLEAREHYPGMCHRWVGVTPFSISPRGDLFCSFLTGGLSFRRGAMVSPVVLVASAICTMRVSMGGGGGCARGVGWTFGRHPPPFKPWKQSIVLHIPSLEGKP